MELSDAFNIEKINKGVSEFINSLKKNDLENAIQTDMDLVKILFNHWHLSQPSVKIIARPILKFWWNTLEETLTNPQIVLDNIQKEDLQEILYTEQGTDWLNRQSAALYSSFYNYLFFNTDPVDTYKQ